LNQELITYLEDLLIAGEGQSMIHLALSPLDIEEIIAALEMK
jgi:hypothetical protein